MRGVEAFVHETRFADLTAPVRRATVRGLTDTLGVAIAGSTTKLSAIVRDHAASQFGAGEGGGASLWCDGRRVSAAGAALANAMTIDALDAHDGFKPVKGHIGCAVVAGTLAMAEALGVEDPADVLAAIAVGYETGARAGMALHATAADYHTSGAWVSLAVAACGARLMGLDGAATREALGIAEYHGPRSQMMRCIAHPTMVKDGSGWGAMAGVSAAYLARDGFTGAPAVTVEGSDVADVWADLGTRWYVTEQYIKPWPVCRWAQPAVQAVLDLKRAHSFAAEEVERIEVATFAEAVALAGAAPATTEEAQYAIAFPVAVACLHGTVLPGHIEGDGLLDRAALALAARVDLSAQARFDAHFPARRLARVTLRLADGRTLVSADTESAGDPENPLGEAEVDAKFLSLVSPVQGDGGARELLTLCRDLPNAASTAPLWQMLAKG